jgi:poly(A) polymerase
MEHPRFRAAYDFLVVRERGGEDTGGMGDWWTRYQGADEEERPALLQELPNSGGGGKRKRSGRRRSGS